MSKLNGFMDKHAYAHAIVFFILALGIDVAAYVGATVVTGFSAFNTVMFVFEVVLHGFLVYALAVKKKTVSNLFMVAIKVFDAIYYSTLIAIRIDRYRAGGTTPTHMSYLNFASYAIATVLLIVLLIFYFLNYFTNNHKYWIVVKVCMLVAAFIMFICSIFEIVNFVKYSAHWFAFLEPIYMCFLLLGMFVVCHYIEKEK